MASRGNLLTLYFYFHLLIIHELGFMITLTYFKSYIQVTGNVAPSQIKSNVWIIFWAFEIIYCNLGVLTTIEAFLYFYNI